MIMNRIDIRSLFESVIPYFDAGIIPSDEILKLKMAEGVYAILNTDINLGFKNLSHFSKVYKEAFGVAPTVHVR